MKTVLSVDVAKNKSMIMLMNSDGEILIDTKEIKHNLEEFKKVKEKIEEMEAEVEAIKGNLKYGFGKKKSDDNENIVDVKPETVENDEKKEDNK